MFCAADTAPVTMWTFTSSRMPLMPIGSRTSSWPSMMNSWVRICRICWSDGKDMARAVSITRSTSELVTSASLIFTMPCEFRLLMWLPAMPVNTLVILQSAISSASSSARWMAWTVESILTTTPFFKPREGCWPRPITLTPPSGCNSATMATIFDVPISSPTIKFFCSRILLITSPYQRRFRPPQF